VRLAGKHRCQLQGCEVTKSDEEAFVKRKVIGFEWEADVDIAAEWSGNGWQVVLLL
jgi:hypothetical protein